MCDEGGSTSHILDETGRILNRYEYDAFGNLIKAQEEVNNRFLYVGQQYDAVTMQYYPVVARFTQEDTYRGDGLNLYAYCRNNPVGYYDPSGYNVDGCGIGKKGNSKSGSDTTRVGRWMSQEEYDKMISSGKVQMSGDNKVHVANPADINAFGKQAPKGSLYVEFDVPSNTISKGGTDGWGIINGPGSLLDRLNAKKGLPRITEMPNATNITIEGSK